MTMFLQLVVAIAAAVVLFQSVATINRMTPHTDHKIRAAFVLLSAGAFGELIAILQAGHQPGIAEALFVTGNGMLAFFCRRLEPRCKPPCEEIIAEIREQRGCDARN